MKGGGILTKAHIVLAVPEEEYLFPLELSLLESPELDAEISAFSDQSCLEAYFAVPRSPELLIIDEAFYSPALLHHSIRNILLLSGQGTVSSHAPDQLHTVYKYADLREIVQEAKHLLRKTNSSAVSRSKAKVITVFSAAGGSGKTTVAMGISACLSQNHGRVLHMDAEHMQNACYFFSDAAPLPPEASAKLQTVENSLYQLMKPYLRQEGFDYLPAFRASLGSLELDFDCFTRIIEEAAQSGDYDYIIADTDCVLDEAKARLLQRSDRIVMVTQQDPYSLVKTERLQSSLDTTDRSRFLYVCNFFEEGSAQDMTACQAYLPRLPENVRCSLSALRDHPDMQRLAFELL